MKAKIEVFPPLLVENDCSTYLHVFSPLSVLLCSLFERAEVKLVLSGSCQGLWLSASSRLDAHRNTRIRDTVVQFSRPKGLKRSPALSHLKELSFKSQHFRYTSDLSSNVVFYQLCTFILGSSKDFFFTLMEVSLPCVTSLRGFRSDTL